MNESLQSACRALGVALPPRGVAVGGKWQSGKGDSLAVRSPIDGSTLAELQMASVEQVDAAVADVRAQVDPDADGVDEMLARYPKAQVRVFDGNPGMVSDLDAMSA